MSEPQTTIIQTAETPNHDQEKQEPKNAKRVFLSPERESEEDDEITSCYVRGYN